MFLIRYPEHGTTMNDTVIPQRFEELISLDQPSLLDEIERLWREDPSMLKRLAAYVIEKRRSHA
jgi:hypothetical protein